MSKGINSLAHWDERFEGDWEANNGNQQSIFFATQALTMLPEWLTKILSRGGKDICDWGCAEGGGTQLLATTFPGCRFTGIDFSANAISTASKRYASTKNITFETVDLLKEAYHKNFDVIFSSNVFEHFSDPFKVFDIISGYAQDMVVMMVPFKEDSENMIQEHLHSFDGHDFKLLSANGDWIISHFAVKNLARIPETQWRGEQAVVAFMRRRYLKELGLTVDDIEFSPENEAIMDSLRCELDEHKKKESRLLDKINAVAQERKRLAHEIRISKETNELLEYSIEDLRLEKDELLIRLRDRQELVTAQQNEMAKLVSMLQQRRYMIADRVVNATRLLYRVARKARSLGARLSRPYRSRNERLRAEKVRPWIEESKLFDPKYYLEHNADVRESGMDPTTHYLLYGHAERRRPSDQFDPEYYLERYPDVMAAGIDPLFHYYTWGKKEGRRPTDGGQTECTPSYAQYNDEWSLAKRTLAQQIIDARKTDVLRIKRMIDGLSRDNTSVIVVPLAYPLKMTQRPDHFLRYFSNQHVPCILLSYDGEEPYIREHKPGVYVTNMIGAAVAYLKLKRTTLLITYPYFSYFVSLLQPTHVVYDVLDDLKTFSGDNRGLQEEHIKLLEQADIVTYSSQLLYEKNHKLASGKQFLVENGVWVDDFKQETALVDRTIRTLRKGAKEKIIGYYGVVGNLLDWELLERMTTIENIRLVFIGPKDDFVNSESKDANAKREQVLSNKKVTYIETVPYELLGAYSRQFDAAIIPFLINEITDPVSPLKLFEYMAAGHKIFTTPTATLSRYKRYIEVGTADALLKRIKVWASAEDLEPTQHYEAVLERVDWARQLAPVLRELRGLSEDKPFRGKYIDIINVNFYDWKGRVLYKGGAERYVFDLATKLIEMGHHPRIVQNATKHFEKQYRGISIVGMRTGETTIRGMSKFYNKVCRRADLVIASPLDLACELKDLDVIGINHGIHWDNTYRSIENRSLSDFGEIFDALKNIKLGVCVDTNFINWTRTHDYLLGHKLKYIPNYYDEADFQPTKKDFNGKLVFLYPRRLYEARGVYITIDAFAKVLERHQDATLLLVGQTDDDKVKKAVDRLIRQYPERVLLEEYDMEDMHKAYAKSHIAIIPTLYSEGTSLSCLEAMATNNALIATNIGGLPNLVVDSYNGLLIDPTASALEEAVEGLIGDRAKIKRMADNGLSFVRVFEKKNWDKKWKRILKEELEQ